MSNRHGTAVVITAIGLVVVAVAVAIATLSPLAGIADEPRIEASPTESPPAPPTTPSIDPTAAATPVMTEPMADIQQLHMLDARTLTVLVNDIQPFGDDRFVAAVNTSEWEHMPATGPHGMDGSIHIGSIDGGWQQVDTGDSFEGVEISDLFLAPDGKLVAYGELQGFEGADVAVGFTSADGRSWEPVATIPWAAEYNVVLADGALGYLAAVTSEAPGASRVLAYRSSDAVTWELVYESLEFESTFVFDAGVGTEGYVISAYQSGDLEAENSYVTLASADGETWILSPEVESEARTPLYSITALGPDWVAAGFSNDDVGIPVYWSANGLDWTLVASIDDPAGRELFGYAAHLVATDGRLYLSAAFQAEGTESRPAGTWTSTDARTWSQLPIGDYAEVRAVARRDGGDLLAGRTEAGAFGNRGADAVIWNADDAWFR